jgi:GT2 family glycosyltransferase
MTSQKAIISGIIEESNGKVIYGGSDDKGKIIEPNGSLNPIENLNGNVVLIPKYVFKKIGKLDPYYHHDLGDVDYGFRAIKIGIGVYTTRSSVGIGLKNEFCRVRFNNSNIVQRFKRLYSPLGCNPKYIFYFKRKKYGFFNASIYFLFLHLLNLIPDSINKLLFGNRYR